MTHGTRFDWGKVYYAGIALGYDNGYAAYRADQAEKRWEKRMQPKKFLPIHLYKLGDRVKVAVEVDGRWVDVIDEHHDSQFSHIVESGGIEKCIAVSAEGAPNA